MTNISELLINLVIFNKPKMLTGWDQKVSGGLLDYVLRAQGQKHHRGKDRVYVIHVTGVEHGKPIFLPRTSGKRTARNADGGVGRGLRKKQIAAL
ncbi:hypothetical protein C1X34_20245 [Pseudomonas sp. GW456-12-10-14-TSB6]|nr:hypothetical protein C1X55_17845 [Pseudomonas sp. GW460-C8]PMW17202.1 hypothetical protein C1X40_17865 [Pseudomonas sp. GW456-11-11-14-TSB2]PMW21111.1 hypothetical protein C1X53_16985 [Pseudomonas sp. GW456-E6]PMW33612.1 hypothetical protein C1X48_22365 [Pseudomonas sp. FW305-3-2-15-A-R2A1]PMW36595.1 hypothetical protein C1X45_15235 [Pseudomonas sp. GW460-7]PMW57458.1 hypothetical protein C1X39_20010 [Pseudomonas sp. GW456-12-1-14-TSB1]PMW66566.1 hypothetical protein C1X31_07225 [Pseudomon